MGNGRFTSLKSYKTSILKQIRNMFDPMAIDVQRIPVTHENLPFLHFSVRGMLFGLINDLGPPSVILQAYNCTIIEFTYISSAHGTSRKITKIL